jgi:hypothetical protein
MKKDEVIRKVMMALKDNKELVAETARLKAVEVLTRANNQRHLNTSGVMAAPVQGDIPESGSKLGQLQPQQKTSRGVQHKYRVEVHSTEGVAGVRQGEGGLKRGGMGELKERAISKAFPPKKSRVDTLIREIKPTGLTRVPTATAAAKDREEGRKRRLKEEDVVAVRKGNKQKVNGGRAATVETTVEELLENARTVDNIVDDCWMLSRLDGAKMGGESKMLLRLCARLDNGPHSTPGDGNCGFLAFLQTDILINQLQSREAARTESDIVRMAYARHMGSRNKMVDLILGNPQLLNYLRKHLQFGVTTVGLL